MDLSITTQDREFRDEVRDFLSDNLTPDLVRAGKRTTSIFSDFDASIEWQKILHTKGWAAPDWPEEYGGPGWSFLQRLIFKNECVRHMAPVLQMSGLLLLAPVLMKFGNNAQKALLPRILSTEDIWAQGYSEPNAGSDLASLQTKAVREGDEYIINGSKIWTSYAHRSNKIFCLVRTSNEGKPQAGISFVLADMDTPGIQCDDIVSLDGEVEQCQVFFDDVRIPVSNLVGEENRGWDTAKYLLEFERGLIIQYPVIEKKINVLRKLAAETPWHRNKTQIDNPVFAAKLAELEIEKLSLEALETRIAASLNAGDNPGVLSSLVKVTGTELSQRVDELALELRGLYVSPQQNQVLEPAYQGDMIGNETGVAMTNFYLNNRASTIYGGSAQVQRNIIARMLMS